MESRTPDRFRVRFRTSRGDFIVEAHRNWAPQGVDRFYSLVHDGFFNEVRFFRVIAGFMAQFGISGDPGVSRVWREARIPDDPVVKSNSRGRLSFATAGPGTRTTQLFINFCDNSRLDDMGFAPIGEVIEGMDVVDMLHAEYGEGAPHGRGPAQSRIQGEGNAYLKREFPQLDYVVSAALMDGVAETG